MKMTPRQALATTTLRGLDDALDRYADAAVRGSIDSSGHTHPQKPRSSCGRRWKKQLSHEEKVLQRLDRIITLLERING